MTDPWLPAEHGSEEGALQGRVASGLTWTLIDTWGTQFLGLVIFVILARLLTEVDFGLVTLAAIFVSFAQLFVDQGLGDALIQRRTVTRGQIDTAFWVAVLTGGLLTIVGIALAGHIATLLRDQRLEPILQVLSLSFIFAAFSSIQMALLRREMRFRSLAIRKLTAVAGAGAVGVALAFLGYGAWSLVGQQLANAAISVVMLWTVSPWRPGLQVSRADFRELFSFGINVVAGDFLNFLSRNADNLLIGIFLGVSPVGFYGVAYRILDTSQSLLVNFARKLAFPIFSRMQGDPDRIRRAYGRVSRTVSVVILPGYVGLALVAQEAIVVIFGEKWQASAPAAAVLFLIGPVLTVQLFSGALLNAVGHPEITFRIRLVTTIVNIVGFLAAVLLFRDIVAVAAAFVIRGYLLMPLILWWQQKYAGIPVRENLSQLRGVAAATIVMSLAVIAVKLLLIDHVHRGLLLVAEVIVGIAAFGIAIWFVERQLVREVATVGLQVLPGGGRIARRLDLVAAQPGGRRGRGKKRRAAGAGGAGGAAEAAEAEAWKGRPVPAEETVTAGSSVAADSLAPAGGGPGEEPLGDV